MFDIASFPRLPEIHTVAAVSVRALVLVRDVTILPARERAVARPEESCDYPLLPRLLPAPSTPPIR